MHDAWEELASLGNETLGDAERDRQAFYRAFGASFFLVSASSHMVTLLDRDPTLGRLPVGVHEKIRTLRNVLEHWDLWSLDKSSAKAFREAYPGVRPYSIRFSGDDLLLGGVLSFRKLEEALRALNDRLPHSYP